MSSIVTRFKRINEENANALRALHELGQSASEESKDQLINALNTMVEDAQELQSDLNDGQTARLKILYDLGDDIEDRVEDAYVCARTLQSKFPHSARLKKRFEQNREKHLYSLKKKFEGAEAGNAKATEITTLHEVIRYLHQVANEAVFSPSESEWDTSSQFEKRIGPGLEGHILLCGDGSKELQMTDPYINALGGTDSIDVKGAKINLIVYALHEGTHSNLQFHMGCHFASLGIRRGNNEHELELRYVDTTDYSTSKFRHAYAAEVLPRIGFHVTRPNSHRFHGQFTGKAESSIETYRKLLRFAATLRDVDCLSGIFTGTSQFKKQKNGQPSALENAVDAFRHGVLNMYDYLSQYPVKSYEQFAKEANTLLPKPLF